MMSLFGGCLGGVQVISWAYLPWQNVHHAEARVTKCHTCAVMVCHQGHNMAAHVRHIKMTGACVENKAKVGFVLVFAEWINIRCFHLRGDFGHKNFITREIVRLVVCFVCEKR